MRHWRWSSDTGICFGWRKPDPGFSRHSEGDRGGWSGEKVQDGNAPGDTPGPVILIGLVETVEGTSANIFGERKHNFNMSTDPANIFDLAQASLTGCYLGWVKYCSCSC